MDNLRNAKILELASKVHCELDANAPGREQFKGWIIVDTKDGRTLEEIEEFNRGSRQNPMTREEIENKFRANAEFRLTDEEAERIIQAAGKIESLSSVSDLVKLTVKPDASTAAVHEQRHLVVESGERFVKKQHLGIRDQRAKNRDRLLLAA